MCAKSLQSYLTLCDPTNYSPPGSSVHRILQARILEWVAVPSCGGTSWVRDPTCVSWVSCILYHYCHHYMPNTALNTMRESRVRSLGREDPLEKEMATHSSSLAWKNPMDGVVWQAIMGLQRVGHDWATSLHSFKTCGTKINQGYQGETHKSSRIDEDVNTSLWETDWPK